VTLYCAGIDVGSLTAEGAIVDGHAAGKPSVRATARIPARANPLHSAREILAQLYADSGLRARDLAYTVSTGYGREAIQEAGLARHNLSEISCHGYGAWRLQPRVRTIIDIGGQDAKAIRVDDQGRLTEFAMNDKCAAGTGHFLELMSRSLEVDLADLGRLALRARQPVHMTSRCSIFVETEVIHFLQRGHRREDVAAGIADAMAERVAALARRVRPTAVVTMTGGVAKNLAVRRQLERRLGLRMVELDCDPQLVGALGAALLAAELATGSAAGLAGAPDPGGPR